MKITTFNPMITTPDAEPMVKLFEEFGFEVRHTKEGISANDATDFRMKNADGFAIDIVQGKEPKSYFFIRINVDNLDEAMEIFKAHGFRFARHDAVNNTVETGSSKFNILVSPTGTIFAVSEHIKD